jgi:hypothetical protein
MINDTYAQHLAENFTTNGATYATAAGGGGPISADVGGASHADPYPDGGSAAPLAPTAAQRGRRTLALTGRNWSRRK